jgi:glycosyltransferase involved in cell wall biosynthesis
MRAFHAGYNPQLALRVVAHLRDTVPGIKLTMAGKDKGLLEQVTKLAEELGLDSIVQFPGFLDMAGKVAAGQAHDIYLNTNRVDNMPVTVLEMAAMGLLIVATNVGGIPDLLSHEETALLVPNGDEEAMVRAVLRLLIEPDLVARLSSNGRQLAQKSSWDNVRPLWEAVFRQVMEGDHL